MKLVEKLTLAFVASMALILAFNGYLRVRREVALFESNQVRDHELIGRALSVATGAVWRSDGAVRALEMLDRTNRREAKVQIRWTWLDGPELGALPATERTLLAGLGEGQAVTRDLTNQGGQPTRYTYVGVPTSDARTGVLELSESLASEEDYVRKTIRDTVATALALGGVFAVLAMILGTWLVGRPMSGLIAKARRVGRGDFSSPVTSSGKDELATLAREMNTMTDRLAETVRDLRHADRLATIGKLASGVAHELGTPLNVISARAEMIASGEAAGDEGVAYAKVIVECTDRVTGIVRQLLEFARRRGPEKAPRDLRQVAAQTVELLKPLAAKRQVTLRVSEGRDLALADVDGAQMQQVVTNIVMNAVQAMTHPGVVDVALSCARATPPAEHGGREGKYVRIQVRDEGSGMSAEQIEHVFEPFYTTKDVGEGTGLGLAVAYGIVREHGGWIDVESAPERGSVFTIHVPAGGVS